MARISNKPILYSLDVNLLPTSQRSRADFLGRRHQFIRMVPLTTSWRLPVWPPAAECLKPMDGVNEEVIAKDHASPLFKRCH